MAVKNNEHKDKEPNAYEAKCANSKYFHNEKNRIQPSNELFGEIIRNWPIIQGRFSYSYYEELNTISVVDCKNLEMPVSLGQIFQQLAKIGMSPSLIIDYALLECLNAFRTGNKCASERSSQLNVIVLAITKLKKGQFLNKICNNGFLSNVTCLAEELHVNVFIKSYIFRIVELQEHENYWFIPSGYSVGKAHAFNLFDISVLITTDWYFFIPSNVTSFLSWSIYSQFMSCNHSLASSLVPLYNKTVTVINTNQFQSLVHLRNVLYEFGGHPILFFGTLLGWQRHCDLIPDTTDMDMALQINEYQNNFETFMKLNKLNFHHILGKPSDSLEFTMTVGAQTMDLFFLYSETNLSWVGGLKISEKKKYKFNFPLIRNFCTAELRGHLFLIPCNFMEFIQASYGPNWKIPLDQSSYSWYESDYNVQFNGIWSDKEWVDVYRPFY